LLLNYQWNEQFPGQNSTVTSEHQDCKEKPIPGVHLSTFGQLTYHGPTSTLAAKLPL